MKLASKSIGVYTYFDKRGMSEDKSKGGRPSKGDDARTVTIVVSKRELEAIKPILDEMRKEKAG